MKHGSEVFSHEGKRLEQHLLHTVDLACGIAGSFGLKLDEMEQRSILLHDLAKAHHLFQRHLLLKKGKFGHAAPSAAVVLAITRNLLYAEAVRRHHSHLENLEDVKRFWSCLDFEDNVLRIVKDIPVWDGAQLVERRAGITVANWYELLPAADTWDDLVFDLVELGEGVEQPELAWLRLRLLYSLLVTADRYDAAVSADIDYQPLCNDLKRVDDYASSLRRKPLADWRQQVRQEVTARAREVLVKPGVYTLTLPTGAGKTLIGLEVAMRAAERFKATGIIYVLPFVSLVEQNADVARKLFAGTVEVREDHHLSSGIDGKDEIEDLTPQERFLAFFRYWQEPVVITTMAKLWDVLYSPKGNDTMSFHRLSRAILILDEPQTIPTPFWQGFGETLKLLSQELNTTFILMTATQPEITGGLELAPKPYQFPRVRHRYNWRQEKETIPGMVEQLEREGMGEKSSLIVLNTRKAALLCYLELRRLGISPYFLSSWVTPVDRRLIMEGIKADEEAGKNRWLVSTQVVEAGVDLDFQLVYRDLGPLDSIIQVAGRCNRHCRYEMGKVKIGELEDENGRSYASYVYDSNLLVATRAILRENFDERDCPELIKAYYRKAREIMAPDSLWNDILESRWGERHPLIQEELPNEVLLVVAYNEVEHDLDLLNSKSESKEKFMELVERKRAAFRRISLHAVSVPCKALEEWSLRVGGMIYENGSHELLKQVLPGIWLVQGKGIGLIYSHRIGFILPELEDSMAADKHDW